MSQRPGFVESIQSKAQEVAYASPYSPVAALLHVSLTQHSTEDFGRAKVMATDAARSGSYWYPIKV